MAETAENRTEKPRNEEDRGLLDLPDFGVLARGFGRWCAANPAGVVALVLLVAVLAYFYFGLKAFLSLSQTPGQWIAAGWTTENDQEHGYAILPVALFLVVLRWRDLTAAKKEPCNLGLAWVLVGIALYIAGIRCVEGRYTIFALPPLLYGSVMFLWGREVARIIAFPAVFLLFMTPIGGVIQGTAALQSHTAKFIEVMCGLFGMKIYTVGAVIHSGTGSFEPLEVAGGCSGIRSFMAMLTLSALYAYFAMRGVVRGLVLFSCAILFALVGNFARVFSIVLVARFLGPGAANSYHDWSGFVFFPFAVMAMVAVGNVINRDWGRGLRQMLKETPKPTTKPAAASVTEAAPKTTSTRREADQEKGGGEYDY